MGGRQARGYQGAEWATVLCPRKWRPSNFFTAHGHFSVRCFPISPPANSWLKWRWIVSCDRRRVLAIVHLISHPRVLFVFPLGGLWRRSRLDISSAVLLPMASIHRIGRYPLAPASRLVSWRATTWRTRVFNSANAISTSRDNHAHWGHGHPSWSCKQARREAWAHKLIIDFYIVPT